MSSAAPPAAEANPFEILGSACEWCGRLTDRGSCAHCRTTATPLPPLPPLLGHVVSWRAGLRRQRGVVVGYSGDQLTVLQDDGTTAAASAARCRDEAAAPNSGAVRTPQGAYLAVADGLALTDPVRDLLRRYALDFTGAQLSAREAAVKDFTALGHVELIDAAGLDPAPRLWHTAVATWRAGRVGEAARMLVDLPAGSYPQRLALWMKAAVTGQLPEEASEPVAAAARAFDRANPAIAAAVDALLHRLGTEATSPGMAAALEASSPGGAKPVLAGAGPGSAAGLLRVLERGSAGPGTDELLDGASPALLDALVEADRVPPSWSERSLYLRARSDIGALSDEEVKEVGADAERARRAVLAGKALPAGLDEAARSRYQRFARAHQGEAAAVAELAAEAGFEDEAVRRALAGEDLPSEELLADHSLASLLLRAVPVSAAIEADSAEGPRADFAGLLLLRRCREQLYRWDWKGAYRTGLHVLRLCGTERYRDEAQSLMAAALWQLGEEQAAITALDSALDGEYSAALQANLAVVAAQLEPDRTAEHLSRMVAEAPSMELRVAAGVHAARIWQQSDPWARGAEIPESVLSSVRPILFEPMGYEDFTDLIRLMSQHDGDWLSGQRAAASSSPHSGRAAQKIWMGLVDSIDVFAAEIAAELNRPEPESWVADLRGSLVQQAQAALAEQGGLEGVGLALALLKARMPMDPTQCSVLFAMSFDQVVRQVDPMQGEPAPELIDAAAHAVWTASSPEVDPKLAQLVREVADSFGSVFVVSRTVQLNQILGQLWPGGYLVPRSPVEVPADIRRMPHVGAILTLEGRATVSRFTKDTIKVLARVMSLEPGAGLAGRAVALHEACELLQKRI